MNNKDIVIKTARRLDTFTFDEMVVVSELEEQELKNILSNLVKEQIIVKNGNKYFFNIKKFADKNIKGLVYPNSDFKPIIIEEEEEYEYFLTLSKEQQERIRKYVEFLNFVNQSGIKIKQGVEIFNQNSGYQKISLSTFSRLKNKFDMYGFSGILPMYSTNHIESSIPGELYAYFKKYYLTNEKLSATEAIYRAQKQLQAEQKIEQPYAYNSNAFFRKLKAEFTQEQIEYFRNIISVPQEKNKIKNEINEPINMLFKDAANIYFNRLKRDNKLEQHMHLKSNYKNHMEEYFGNMRIVEIIPKIVAKFKQKKFDSGYQLTSVNSYILTLRNIILEVCPNTNKLASRSKRTTTNNYAMDMNLLSDEQILKLLNISKNKYPETYPIIYIALSTGASIPELLALTWDKIDFENKIMSLKDFLYGNRLIMNKCNSTMRKLKINTKIYNMLKIKYHKLKPNLINLIFKFSTSKFAQQYIEEDVLTPLAKELDIPKLNPSDMQHNFVNICLKQNIPITFIQKSIGFYGIVNFVKTYKNLIEKLEEENYNPLDKIMNDV